MDVYALVAQGIEQWFPVPRVGGSNPSGRFFFYLFELSDNRKRNETSNRKGGKQSG